MFGTDYHLSKVAVSKILGQYFPDFFFNLLCPSSFLLLSRSEEGLLRTEVGSLNRGVSQEVTMAFRTPPKTVE
jgi:hypothetical protein